jgi:hypothetical protein
LVLIFPAGNVERRKNPETERAIWVALSSSAAVEPFAASKEKPATIPAKIKERAMVDKRYLV